MRIHSEFSAVTWAHQPAPAGASSGSGKGGLSAGHGPPMVLVVLGEALVGES